MGDEVENIGVEIKEVVEEIIESVKSEAEEAVEEVKEQVQETVEEIKEQVQEKVKEVITEVAENAVEKVEEIAQKKCGFLLPFVKILRAFIPKKKQISTATVNKCILCDECKKKVNKVEEPNVESV